MIFYLEPTWWALFLASLTACGAGALMRSIGWMRALALLSVWAGATGTSSLICGTFPALLSAGLSALAGAILLAVSIVWSGVKSMPKRRFEER